MPDEWFRKRGGEYLFLERDGMDEEGFQEKGVVGAES